MSSVVVLLLFAGLSEAAGRIVPLVSRRPGMSRTFVAGLLLAAGLVEAAVFALWPLTAWTLAELVLSSPPPGAELVWTPSLLVPLVFSAVLAFPLLGPMLHLLLFVGVGAGLAGPSRRRPGSAGGAPPVAWPSQGPALVSLWRGCVVWSYGSVRPGHRR